MNDVGRLSRTSRAEHKGQGKPPAERQAAKFDAIESRYANPAYLPNARDAMKEGEMALAAGRYEIASAFLLLSIASTLVGQGGKR